ncbi:hypothetical protein QQP08_024248 [Theobroma cacao]|nr:hypothetical protein QQP08_024248 [Theobroma cacao]
MNENVLSLRKMEVKMILMETIHRMLLEETGGKVRFIIRACASSAYGFSISFPRNSYSKQIIMEDKKNFISSSGAASAERCVVQLFFHVSEQSGLSMG